MVSVAFSKKTIIPVTYLSFVTFYLFLLRSPNMANSAAKTTRQKVPCHCVGCKGRKRTRKTLVKHRSKQQKPISQSKICYCRKCVEEHPSGVMVGRKTFARHMAKHGSSSKTPILEDDSQEIFEFESSVEEEFEDIDLSSADELEAAYDEREESRSAMENAEGEGERALEEQHFESDDSADSSTFSYLADTSNSTPKYSDSDDDSEYGEYSDYGDYGDGELQKELDWIELVTPMTRNSQEKLVSFFDRYHPDLALPSIYRVNKRLEKRSGLKPIWYHCCINSCMAFTGEYADFTHCKICKEARYHAQLSRKRELKPRKKWLFFPVAPRLLKQFRDPEKATYLSTYRAQFDVPKDAFTDIFSGDLYQSFHRRELQLFSR